MERNPLLEQMEVALMTVNDLLGWLHENPFYPNRRRQALWYAIKYLMGQQLATFARYAKSISYVFSRDDLALLNQVIRKAQGAAAPQQQQGIGQFGEGALPDEVPGVPMEGAGPGMPGLPDWMSGVDEAGVSDEGGMIPGLSDGNGTGGGIPGMGGEAVPSQGPGGSNYLGGVIGILAGAVAGAVAKKPTAAKIPVGTRNAQNPDYIWSGTGWVYSPLTAPTTAGTTGAAPTATQTNAWRAAGKLTVGAKTTSGWTWNGATWVQSSQYTPTAPTAAPTYTAPTAPTDNKLLWGFGLLALYLALSQRRIRG
jgi:hypothetical protein